MFRKSALTVLLCIATVASANEAAPYSADANARLERVQRKMVAPDINTPDSRKNVANYLDYLNKLYTRADYNFPRSLADYYEDVAETHGVIDHRVEAGFISNTVSTLHSLMKGMSAEDAFPGNEFEAVRVAYKSMRTVEQGIKLSEAEIARLVKRRTGAEKKKAAQLQREKDARTYESLGMGAVIAVIASCLIGFLLWPVSMYFRREKLAAKERAAPYVYIKKHAGYPDIAHNK